MVAAGTTSPGRDEANAVEVVRHSPDRTSIDQRHDSLPAPANSSAPLLNGIRPASSAANPRASHGVGRRRRSAIAASRVAHGSIPELPREEREHVGLLGGPLADRLADAVTGAALLVQQDRALVLIGGRPLQQRRHLAGVHRVDPGVALGGA